MVERLARGRGGVWVRRGWVGRETARGVMRSPRMVSLSGHLGDERAVHDESAARIMQVVETESSLLRLDVDRQPWRGQKVVESTMSATEVGLAAMGKAEVRVLDCIGTLRPRAASEHEDEACGGGPRRHLGGPPAPQQHTQATHPSELRHSLEFSPI